MFRLFRRRQDVKPKCRWAGVYLHKERVMVHAGGLTREGFGIAVKPAYSCDWGDTESIGRHLREALAQSRWDIEFPEDRNAHFRPILKQAGATSWRKLETEATYVYVWEEGAAVRLMPHRTGGTRGVKKGFEPLCGRERDVDVRASDEKLGAAVQAAFDDCVPFTKPPPSTSTPRGPRS